MDRVAVSKLIFGKSKKYLRISTILFIMSLTFVATLLVFVENQYLQMRKDFVENENTRIIQIGTVQSNGRVDYLRFADAARIKKKLKLEHPNSAFKVINQYQFNFGITDTEGNAHFLFSLDEVGASLLGDRIEFHPGTAYSIHAPANSSIELMIPVIEVVEGGMRSVEAISYILQREAGVSPNNPFALFEHNSNHLYIAASTYRQIIELVFATDWSTFVERFDRDNPYGIAAINRIFVSVGDLSDVRPMVRTLSDMGFGVHYILKAFDDLAASVRTTAVLMSILTLAVFLGAAAYIVLSFNACLRIQQKDMGILKHFGYSTADLEGIYSIGINHVFLRAGLVVAAYTLIITAVLVPSAFLFYVTLNLAVILGLILAVNRIIVSVLKMHARGDIISLLKVNKEFE